MNIILVFAVFVLFSCGSGSTSDRKVASTNKMESFDDVLPGSEASSDKSLQPENRKLIKRGEIRFQTDNAKQTRDRIAKLVQKHNGYPGNDKVTTHKDRIEYEIVAHIPAQSFDKFVQELAQGVDYIDYQRITVDDVTAKFIDIEARLKSKKAMENRLLDLLKKAGAVKEMLDVENELGKVRADIESMEQKINALSQNIAYSRLSIRFYEHKASGETAARSIGSAFMNGVDLLADIFIGILKIWPVILIFILVVFLIIRHDKKTQKTGKGKEKGL